MIVNTCYLCNASIEESDFCHGCQEWICGCCDETSPFGGHDPEDHLEKDEGEGEV